MSMSGDAIKERAETLCQNVMRTESLAVQEVFVAARELCNQLLADRDIDSKQLALTREQAVAMEGVSSATGVDDWRPGLLVDFVRAYSGGMLGLIVDLSEPNFPLSQGWTLLKIRRNKIPEGSDGWWT
jgi:RES domain-containing protein